jgi:hypothetical protein
MVLYQAAIAFLKYKPPKFHVVLHLLFLTCNTSHYPKQSQPTMSSQLPRAESTQFYLLDLPLELRLMVYEHLPYKINRTSHHDIGLSIDVKSHYVIETTRCASTAILGTCRRIHDEAKEIVRKSVEAAALSPTRLILETPCQEGAERFDSRCTLINDSSKVHATRSHNTASITWTPHLGWHWPGVHAVMPSCRSLVLRMYLIEGGGRVTLWKSW